MKRIEIIGVDTSSLPKISGEESRQYLLEIKNGNEEKEKRIYKRKYQACTFDCTKIFQRAGRGGRFVSGRVRRALEGVEQL